MIRRISETWKQQKSGSGSRRQQRQAKPKVSSLQKVEEQSVACTTKAKATDAVSASSFDWGASDSLFIDGTLQPNNDKLITTKPKTNNENKLSILKSPELNKNDFTRIVTRSMVSTPQIKIKENVAGSTAKKQAEDIDLACKSSKNKKRLSAEKKNSMPSPELNSSLQLSQWGLPEVILENYKAKGINKMFEWQKECLLQDQVLDGANLIYSAPTSAGKTLVAEILMLKRVLETEKKAIYILPFVSVAREKMYSLRNQFEEAGINVGGFMGNETPPGGLTNIDIAICTIERANSLINRLMEEDKLSLLGSIVIDEMHMIGDPSRGYLLELLLTKIRFLMAKNATNVGENNESSSNHDNGIQIIGMSATLPNLDMMARWLDARFYVTDYRPVPLDEYLKTSKTIYDCADTVVRTISPEDTIKGDDDDVINLCLETMRDTNSVLIFCPTKNWCEKLSISIANYLANNVLSKESDTENIFDKEGLQDVLSELQQTPAGLDPSLEKVVSSGVSYHHAGLTMDERDIIEGAFRRGVLKIIIATSTLSSGVNLPARRVIIRSPMFHGKLIDALVYKQMVGRAGRKGVDTQGESILICKPNEKQKSLAMMTSLLKPVYSCLLDASRTMNRALLEVIAGGVAVSPPDVELYAKSTYLNTCLAVQTGRHPEELICTSMKFLLENDFIKLRFEKNKDDVNEKSKEQYFPSQLGTATMASSMKPDEAIIVYTELQKARRNFCLENELHIIYQVTPTSICDQWPDLDWYTYYNIWERLSAQCKHVGEMIGVKESFLGRAMQNRVSCVTAEQKRVMRIHRRFYGALVLNDLCNEVPMSDVSRKYKVHKGLLQSLQNSAATYAGMMTVFCKKLGWSCLEVLLEQFQSRLSFGVCRDLCNLVRISLLNRFTARLFYQNGFQTVSAIANASEKEISKLLRESTPFYSNKLKGKDAEMVGKSVPKCLWLSGKEGLSEQEAGRLIIDEAKRILAADAQALGIPIGQLNLSSKNSTISKSSSSSSGKKRRSSLTKSTIKRRNRKRASAEKITPLRSSKRLSPEQRSGERVDSNSKVGTQLAYALQKSTSQSPSPVLREIQNLSTQNLSRNLSLADNDMSLFQENQVINTAQKMVENLSNDSLLFGESLPNILGKENQSDIKMTTDILIEQLKDTVLHNQLSDKSETQDSLFLIPNQDFNSFSTKNQDQTMSEQTPNLSEDRILNTGNFCDKLHTQDSLFLNDKIPSFSTHTVNKTRDIVTKDEPESRTIAECELNHQEQQGSVNSKKTKRKTSDYLESSDSLLLLSDSALKPKEKSPILIESPKTELSVTTPSPNLSLRLSTTDEALDTFPKILPPMKLHSQFNDALTGEASTLQRNLTSVTSPEVDLFDQNIESNDNSGDLFESTELFTKNSTSQATERVTPQETNLNESASNEFLIIDVASSKTLFLTFIQEWKAKSSFTVAFSCETHKPTSQTTSSKIGRPLRSARDVSTTSKPSAMSSTSNRLLYTRDDLQLTGLAICWGKKDSYYISLQEDGVRHNELDDTALPPDVCQELPLPVRLKSIQSVLNQHASSTIMGFDLKEQLKIIYELCDTLLPKAVLKDPKVAHWLLEPSQREKNLFGITKQWLDEDHVSLTEGLSGGVGTRGFGMVPKPGCSGRVRACVESVLVNQLMSTLHQKLTQENLLAPFLEIEMPSLRTLSIIEINGIGFCDQACEKLKKLMKDKLSSLEKQCYQLAKRTFSLTSPDDVGRVLFIELALPCLTENGRATRTKGKVKHFRTSKDVLEKLVTYHRLPKLILEWRRINSTLTKIVYPVQRKKLKLPEYSMYRIYTESQFHTSTGRVTFTEPNIQNVPKEFDIKVSVNEPSMKRTVDAESPGVVKAVSMRGAFVPFEGGVFVSADYSQLELRIMAHLSGDVKLIKAINESKDVFKSIAAEIYRIDADEVMPSQRQQAKQVCYGILYGIGSKSLAEQLETNVEEAAMYVENFKRKFKGVNSFIKKTIDSCRKLGYVSSMAGRKRYLPAISSSDSHARSQAERQSVNTAVQGSAADLVKKAMNNISDKLREHFSRLCLKRNSRGSRSVSSDSGPAKGAFLVLQIHDELLYEVNRKDVDLVLQIIRNGMENAYKLLVKTPVKMHIGNSWGQLKDVE
ncbi:DNA polymerase theta-like isoform X2 [Clytia hemisphaerica]|uniref:DNA polymerase theta-like isoform X2 n=1 Tax=Clytia hemisphaerica TaxID=252671 RepID=UPI0034D7A210